MHPRLGLTEPAYERFIPVHLRPRLPPSTGGRGPARAGARLPRGAPRRAAVSPPGDRGALALVLHSHMPYVEGFGTWPFGEEWLWEAVATVYLPLLEVLEGAPVTVGLTPVLCDQLEAMRADAGERFLAYLREVKPLVHAEAAAGLDEDGEPAAAAELRRAAADYERAEQVVRAARSEISSARSRDSRASSSMASSATHAVLPLLATDSGLRLQLGVGVASHERRLGAMGGRLLAARVRLRAGPRARPRGGRRACSLRRPDRRASAADLHEHLEPIATAAGPVAVPIDWDTVDLVWGSAGYPAGAAYRDSFRRTRHDLAAWSVRGEPYRPADALAQAEDHARDFVDRVIAPAGRPPRRTRTPGASLLRARLPSSSATSGTRDRRGSRPSCARRGRAGSSS
ncbi:MAG: hypothetical protein WKF31_03505 [Thermoleophilaceae bacterium]